jgi:hypothetical protein
MFVTKSSVKMNQYLIISNKIPQGEFRKRLVDACLCDFSFCGYFNL